MVAISNFGTQEGERIVSLKRNGVPVMDDDIFTIALSNYRASGGGDFYMLPSCPTVQEILTDMSDLIAAFIERHPVIDFAPVHNITVTVRNGFQSDA